MFCQFRARSLQGVVVLRARSHTPRFTRANSPRASGRDKLEPLPLAWSKRPALERRIANLVFSSKATLSPDQVRDMLASLELSDDWTASAMGLATPGGSLTKERSELPLRLLHHRDVLRLWARKARRPDLAECYCEHQPGGDRSSLWLALLEIYIATSPHDPRGVDAATCTRRDSRLGGGARSSPAGMFALKDGAGD